MKKSLTILGVVLANTMLAATAAYTNVNGMALGLEFAQTTVMAGERLIATMVVSNVSRPQVNVRWNREPLDHTRIGKFVVMDDTGYVLPLTVPFHYYRSKLLDGGGRGMGATLGPGSADRQSGDVVWNYSGLTNPGNYFVKAVITHVPLPSATLTMPGETPWVAVTVTPRPADVPPAGHLYPEVARMTPDELAEMKAAEARFDELMAVERRAAIRAAMPPAPRNAPQETLPPNGQATAAQSKNTFSANPDQPAPTTRTRNVLYALAVLLLVGGLGIYLWSRRKHGHS